MKKITYDIEWDLERSHWWFDGRRRLLKFLISSLDIRKNSPVIDVGCGVGSNLTLLKSMGYKVIGIDSEIYSLSLARKVSGVPLVNGDLLMLPVKSNAISLLIATDILEHLEKDAIGLREIYRSLEEGGKVILTVPAFRFLWGTQDIVGMHKQRYTKKELLRKIEQEGFIILKSSYFNLILFFPILLMRRMIRLFGLKIQSENKINHPIINFFLKILFSVEPYLLKNISFPFGVSIFCIAKKG
ncbi:MAG: class I SAM-dependent methyltransferase [Thermodesulfobacteriota bacterium]|nr:class I SAM-dependent methyltransferase [Thermodesulfobacteriota bacterium]